MGPLRARRAAAVAVVLAGVAGGAALAGCAGPAGSSGPGASHSVSVQIDPPPAPPTAAGANEITDPRDGSTVAGPSVTVRGQGTAFEATLLYRVVDLGTGVEVDSGFTMAGSMGEIGPFEIPLELTPGLYRVEVWAPDMSDDGDSPQTREYGGAPIDLVAVTFSVS